MPGALWLFLTAAETLTLVLAVVLVVLLALIAYRSWQARRIPPEEIERQRREMLVATGKMGDATLVEVREGLIFYSYDVRGVEYIASQDVSRLVEYLPSELPISTPVMVRYDARNPANSIVVAERWTGLRETKVG